MGKAGNIKKLRVRSKEFGVQGKGGLMPDIQSMIGKEVEVIANGMLYTGVLIEVSDVEVHLKGAFQWIALPVSAVSEMKLKAGVTPRPDRFSDRETGQ
jgi:hypothetical protein